jgi:SnoaL-like domain
MLRAPLNRAAIGGNNSPGERDTSRFFLGTIAAVAGKGDNPKACWRDKMNVSFPRRHLVGIGAALASVAFAGKTVLAAPTDPIQTVQWDDKAAEEVRLLLHRMHHAWKDGDLEFMKRFITEEGFVGIFELTADEQPVVLNSRQELLAFIENLVGDVNTSGAHTETSPRRSHRVLATSTFAICTEESDLIERHPDGSRYVLPHRGTSVLAKTADGWKFVHWHVSLGGLGKRYDASGRAIT